MKTLKRQQLGTVLVSFALLLAAAQGCNDSNDNAKPPDVNGGGSNSSAGENNTAGSAGKTASNGGSNGKAGSANGAGSGTEGGTGSTEGGTSPVGGSDAGGAGAGGAPATPACTLPELGADGCFNCPKNGQVAQWLNRCSDADCEPFPNKDRLPLLKADGSVPALPN